MRPNSVDAAEIAQQLAAARLQVKADYDAARPGRFTRTRTRLGGSGDAHYASEADFDRVREYARDMDRNDGLVGPLVHMAVTNQLQTGFRVEPDTGDEALNRTIKDAFEVWADDPYECDQDRENSFWELCWFALRSTYVDGDAFALLTQSGSIQMIEADRCRSPLGVSPNMVHGVELRSRQKIAYWFSRDSQTRHTDRTMVRRVPARDEDGEPQVLHLYNPMTVKRKTQSRGISAFAPVFFRLGMYEDTQFAHMVQQQVLACMAIFLERGPDYTGGTTSFGQRSQETDDSNTRTLEKINPGAIIRGARGEKATVLSPNVPSAAYHELTRVIVTEIGLNIGLPLVLALMDASETNFSGWRGAVDQARMGFRVNQKWFCQRFLCPVYRWKVRQLLADGALGRVRIDDRQILKHRWGMPAWPYIQPLQDAQATATKLQTGQMTPAEMARESGSDWEPKADESVRNWAYAVRAAKAAAAEINDELQDDSPVHWRELLNLQLPQGITISGAIEDRGEQPQEATDAAA